MKKIFALLLAVCMVLTMTAAMAETRTFMLVGVTDAEGNTVVSDEYPLWLFAMNDETMVCAFGTEDETIEGTFEVIELNQEEGYAVLALTLSDGTELEFVYEVESDTVSFIDEEGFVFTMINVELLVEADAA